MSRRPALSGRLAGWFAAGAAALLLSACAVPQQTAVGTSRADVLQGLGTPTATYALPQGGERLQYSYQPGGQLVYNLDFGPDGRLARPVEQSMDPAIFDRIRVDEWTRDDVLRAFGRPARIERVWSFNGEVWIYRYEDFYWPWLLGVHVDPAGVVRKLSRTEEFPRPADYE